MSNRIQYALIILGLIASFIWLKIPELEYYTTQFAAIIILLYFVVRFLGRQHLLPWTSRHAVNEFGLITAGLYLLIGSTGNLQSLFFPLTYVHLFFLAMSLRLGESVSLTIFILLFHLGLSPNFSSFEINQLLSIPLLLLTFLFTRYQLDDSMQKTQLLFSQEEKMTQKQTTSTMLLATFLKPKLQSLLKLSEYPEANQEALQRQILIILDAIEEEVQQLRKE